MNVKLDTKEKFTVITAMEVAIPANMAEELQKVLLPHLDKSIPHIILNMEHVESLSEEAANTIATLQQRFYEQNASFIVCSLQNTAISCFKELDLLDSMNITPTESEAWDILQMEEIEREIMGDAGG